MQPLILIIEDDERMAELIRRGLEENGYNVTLATDGGEGLSIALENHFDVVVTDILLPTKNGLELCKELKKANEKYPIIMLTALGTTDDKIDGFDAGADDYMVKPFEMRELTARINALIKRSRLENTEEIIRIADLELDQRTKTVKRGGKELNLTPKEFNLLAYMMTNKGRVLSKSEIAEKVWDMSFDTGTNFIEVYISYLRRKVDKGYDKKLIHTKSGMGFILKEDHED
ncbi:response regulator transcription factor [Bacteroidaceae bacterium HV4-6-C5C]|jgi:DNA-binding response OmpR family regulator|nr:response regulator transcription factor [Bacteroidaceae bacterium HV4-6-C5C]